MPVPSRTLPGVALALMFFVVSAHAQDTVIVRSVLSGNTIELESGARVALLGVGIPRSKALGTDLMRDNLRGIIEGKSVVLVDDSTGSRRSRTRAAYVYYEGSLINLELIEDGFASSTNTAHSRLKEFQAAEHYARRRQIAAWSTEGHLSVPCSARIGRSRCRELTRHISGRCERHRPRR